MMGFIDATTSASSAAATADIVYSQSEERRQETYIYIGLVVVACVSHLRKYARR
jgi:hypothetical protein